MLTNFLIKISIIVSFVSLYSCLYLEEKSLQNQNYERCESVSIVLASSDQFDFEAICNGNKYEFNFEKIKNDKNDDADVYIQDEDSKLEKIEDDEYENDLYEDDDNHAIGYLDDNNDLILKNVSTEGPLRAFVSVHSHRSSYVIAAVLFSSNNNVGELKYVLINNGPNKSNNKKNKKDKRVAFSGQVFNVEYLLILDNTVYNKYLKLYPIDTIKNIKLIYSNIIKGVDQKYQNSLSSDPDIRINVKLTNILIYLNPADTPWTNTSLAGIPGVPIFNNNEPLNTVTATNLLSKTINSKVFPFQFDYALAVTTKDLWNGNAAYSNQARSSTTSYSLVGGICNAGKYSIMEDMGFNAIYAAARLLAVNIGAVNDGSGTAKACPAYLNYIMTPSAGFFQDNLVNLNYFSSCSIATFKTQLFNNKFGNCLKNTPIVYDSSIPVPSDSPGSVWSIDDQCKLLYGLNSTAKDCIEDEEEICNTIPCLEPFSNICILVDGWGALDGTPCGIDKNKVCRKSVCV